MSQLEEVAMRHAKALGYAEAMLVAIEVLADDPVRVRAAVAEAKAEIARLCADGEVPK